MFNVLKWTFNKFKLKIIIEVCKLFNQKKKKLNLILFT